MQLKSDSLIVERKLEILSCEYFQNRGTSEAETLISFQPPGVVQQGDLMNGASNSIHQIARYLGVTERSLRKGLEHEFVTLRAREAVVVV